MSRRVAASPRTTERRNSLTARVQLASRLYVSIVCAGGAAVLLSAMAGGATEQPLALAALLAVSLIASLAKVEIAVLGSSATLTACHIIDLLALLMCGPKVAIVVSAWSGWTQCTFRNRRANPLHQTAFSVAALALSMGAAGSAFRFLGGEAVGLTSLPLKPFAAAGTLFFVLNSGMVAGAVAMSVGDSFRRVWFDFFLSVWPSYAIGAALSAVLAVGLRDKDYWLVPLLVASLVLLHRNYQACLARMNDGITDPLTGLPNKRFAVDYVARELARVRRNGGQVALALLDMDGFKRINDVSGHAAGDRALRHVGQSLVRSVRESDLCARYGGDEFLLVMPDCSGADARRRIKEIQAAVIAAGRDAQLGDLNFSAGIAVFPEDGAHFDALFATADARMYRSKFERVSRTG